jgi:hypothetical protein
MLTSCWFQYLRAVLELLYFLSGIGVVVAVGLAFKQVRAAVGQLRIASEQLSLTKTLAEANNRREAVKLASDLCRYFAEHVVPALTALVQQCRTQGVTFYGLPPKPAFALKDGEFTQADFDMKTLAVEIPKVDKEIIEYLNALESFAIPFAAGVAADDIGFQETAHAFCTGVTMCMPAVFFVMTTQGVQFASLRKLYNIWNDRIMAKAMAPAVKQMQQFIEETAKKKIDTI